MGSRPDHSTGRRAGLRNTRCIRPRIVRGGLYFQVADVLFPTFAGAVAAWSAAEVQRLGVAHEIQTLIVQRTAALAELRNAGADMEHFRIAARSEAELASQIRQLRRQGGAP